MKVQSAASAHQRSFRTSTERQSLTVSCLLNLRKKAIRKGVWFSALTRRERDILDLTIRYVNTPRNLTLINVLGRIVKKLIPAVKGGFLYTLEVIGHPIAEQRVKAALSWGNDQAKEWLKDRRYWQFLGLNVKGSSWKFSGVQ